jgi:hypothetical protein
MFFGTTGTTDATYSEMFFTSADKLEVAIGYTTVARIRTTQVFRDPSAWQHIVIAYDNTQATASNRLRLYVNGTEVTDFDSDSRSAFSNTDLGVNSTQTHYIGIGPNSGSNYLSAYLTNIHLIDGQQLTPSSFTETDATTGQLIPKTYTGTYGLVSVAAATGALPVFNTTDTYGAVKGTGTRTDTNSASIVLAVGMDGTNGGTTFTDESATIKGSGSAKAITVNSATTSTSQSKFYGSSGSFNGSNTYLSLADSADWAFGSGDFTVETWAYLNSGLLYFGQGDGGSPAFIIYGNIVYIGPSIWTASLTFTTPPTSSWFHFALVRNGNTLTVYINGLSSGSLSYSSTWPDSSDTLTIGQTRGVYTNGYFQDFRVYKGVAKYTSNFSPVVSSNNSFNLLFADNSSNTASTLGKDTSGLSNNWTPNNFSVLTGTPVTVAAATGALPILNTTDTYGATLGSGVRTDALASSVVLDLPMGTSAGLSLTDQSPTGRTSGIKTITNEGITNSTSVTKFYGGAAFFNNAAGGNIGITTPNSADFNFGTGDFTIEFWVYNTLNSRRQWYLRTSGQDDTAATGFMFELGPYTSIVLQGIPYNFSAFTVNTWSHCAVTRSGTTLRIFKDGILDQTYTSSVNVSSGNELWVGKNLSGYSFGCNMYLQDLRIYKGVAKYTSAFSVPVSPQQQATVAAGNDSLVDSPTNYGTDTGVGGEVRGNYCTLNPLAKGGDIQAPTNGNLQVTSSGSGYGLILGTIGVSTGKWYWEVTTTSANCATGIATNQANLASYGGADAYSWVWASYSGGSNKRNNNSASSYGSILANGDVVGIAFDADSGTLTFYKNGVSQGNAYTGIAAGTYLPVLGDETTAANIDLTANFGQRAFAYTAPSGFKALNTQNLPAPLVMKSNTVMDVLLWTGNGASSRSLTGLNFSPDFAWIKRRNSAAAHTLWDSVRGLGSNKELSSSDTAAEGTTVEAVNYGYVSALNSNGLTVNTGAINAAYVNANSDTYVGWTWDAGTSTVSNTQGSITSQVRANPTAGFSVVTYEPTSGWTSNTNATVGHGLGVKPALIIAKNTERSIYWSVYHSALGAASWLRLNTTDAAVTTTVWGNPAVEPTSTVFTFGDDASVGYWANERIVAYVFSPVVGYSSFGSVTLNGTTDNAFAYLGFRPAFVCIKRVDGTSTWSTFDSKRDTYNVSQNILDLDSSGAERVVGVIDMLSNGFKVRYGISGTWLYMAFAESPFNYSRAR